MDTYQAQTADFETIIDFLRFGVTQANASTLYYGHGTDNAWDEMLRLILGSLSLPEDTDPLFFQARLTDSEKQLLNERLWLRIVKRVPVPYLTKKSTFCELPFYVDERVLIPRSPFAELIQQHFSPWLNETPVEHILDLCTGSACIAIACAYAFPEALVDAVDISKDALEVAAINREQHGLQDVLRLIESDCWANVPKIRYDLIVSNPPYVGFDEMQTLPEEYRHEPKLALETGNNGLEIVEKILNHAHHYLSEQGILVVEVGNSEEAIGEAFPNLPFTWLDFEYGGQGVFLLTHDQLKAHFASEGE
ncbi:MAG: 50S ribosomal protein L3 N(5)-glutamine methyltransferase [Tatlockia sp.]|jgi:ribosomal protein L3 glutamine methyltransferase